MWSNTDKGQIERCDTKVQPERCDKWSTRLKR